MQILNYFYFIIISFWGLNLLFHKYVKMRSPFNARKYLAFEGTEAFWVLTFSTGLLALSAKGIIDLMAIRLLIIEILCFIGFFICKNKTVWNAITIAYIIYLGWLFIGLSYSPSAGYGMRVILKYLYPLIIMIFASAAIRDKEVFLISGLWARKVAVISIIISFIPYLEIYVFPGVIWYGTARAINYITMCMFSMALYFHTGKQKKDLYFSILFILPCILWVFRTSMIGTTAALMAFFYFKYKAKSLPVIFAVITIFVISIFAIPQIRQKMFFNDKGKNIENLQGGEISISDINSNGRFNMWESLLHKFYHKKEVRGSGTGNTQHFMYSNHVFGGLKVPHNDYIQILCDNGLIGLALYLITTLGICFHSFIIYNSKKSDTYIRICAITAGSSMLGLLVTMFTDNVVNYSMATLAYPFGFYGMTLGLTYKIDK